MKLFKTKILGTGKYHPEKIITNEDISKMVETTNEWIIQRTGIKERRIADISKGETASGMSEHASRMALKNAELEPNDIDFILSSVTIADTLFPNMSSCLQAKLGITNKCGVLDVNSACTGWVSALTLANGLIQTGVYKKILLTGTEMASSFNNWEDRNTCILFGDGAGAVVLGRCEEEEKGSEIIDSIISCDGTKGESLIMRKGGSMYPITKEILEKREQFMEMDGPVVFKSAVKTMSSHALTLLKRNNMTIDDVDWYIPHQANLRIIETTGQLLKCPPEKVIVNVENYANTSSASIPVALNEAIEEGKVKRGQVLLFTAFGSGLTSAATLLRY